MKTPSNSNYLTKIRIVPWQQKKWNGEIKLEKIRNVVILAFYFLFFFSNVFTDFSPLSIMKLIKLTSTITAYKLSSDLCSVQMLIL